VIRRLVRFGALAFVLVLVAVIWAEQRALSRHAPGVAEGLPVDAVIVLGGGMDFDRMLNGLGRERVRTGLGLLAAGQARAVIFTGALGETRDTSEAALMHAFALSLGTNPARLRIEANARTTLENLRFSFRIAEEEGWTRLAIVTDAFHLTRAGALAALLGRPDVALVASDGLTKDRRSTRAALILRETLAWPLNALKAAGWILLGWLGWSGDERGALIV
jgi:uncharacterized SAM-binding protein YcdF (DUF218 family)